MAVAYGALAQSGLLSQQYGPPLLPKPGKDNLRLQKLLKRTAKKKASAQASQSVALFRSSLSPVNEASPDLEHSDHSTPPKTPETPFSLNSVQHPPRFTVRPLYQHVASPYPQRAARLSPQAVAMPSYSYLQHVTTVSSYSASTQLSGDALAPGPVAESVVLKISLPAFSVPETTVSEGSAAAGKAPPTKGPGPTPYSAPGGQAVIHPLTVLTPIIKCKSPRPTFKATEPSRSPKPMFDVPQIRMYTASTSYYESSRTPPVYDTAGLTSIGSTVPQSKTSETKQDLTPVFEARRSMTPTAQPPILVADPQSKTTSEPKRGPTPSPTADIKRATPTAEIKRATPTSEIKRATPTSEIKRATPTSEIKRATPTSDIKRATPTSEIKRATPTSEIKRATPTAEFRVKTPTFEFQTSKSSAGRPKTPAYHVTRAKTPVFEFSRPNPLLFVVSPGEPEKSKMLKTVSGIGSFSASQSVKTIEPKPTETILNGHIHSNITPEVKSVQQSIIKSKSEPDLTRATAPAGSQRSTTPTSEPKTPAVTAYSNQRPKTPTYEASRLMTASPGYKRPKTPTYGTPPSGVSAFQRPKTPTQIVQKSKSGYRGLTPAEYAAYGGIRTYTPAFGISSSTMQTEEEVEARKKETPSQELSVKGQSTSEVSKAIATPKDADKPHVTDEKDATTPSIPVIIVSQASDTAGTMLTQEISTVSSQVSAKQERTVIPETPKSNPPTGVGKIPEKQKAEVQEDVTPKTKPPEAKHPLPKGDQDPLVAVRKLLGKDKVQKSGTETNADIPDKKDLEKPVPATKTKIKDSQPSTTALSVTSSAAESRGSEDKREDKKEESASAVKSTPEKKEGYESLQAEPLLKVLQKPKGMKSKLSGWSRLKKHMVVEQEEPKFPENSSQEEATGLDVSEVQKANEKAVDKPDTQDMNQTEDAPIASKMWNAVLFQMFSTKENIMHQIELNKTEEEKEEGQKDESKEIPSFAHRLPVLLFSPKFDAKKLKEAASRPVTKISTVFEMGLIGRKVKDEEPKDFNRTARGFTVT